MSSNLTVPTIFIRHGGDSPAPQARACRATVRPPIVRFRANRGVRRPGREYIRFDCCGGCYSCDSTTMLKRRNFPRATAGVFVGIGTKTANSRERVRLKTLEIGFKFRPNEISPAHAPTGVKWSRSNARPVTTFRHTAHRTYTGESCTATIGGEAGPLQRMANLIF